MTKSHIAFLVVGSILALLSVNAQQNQVENFPLSANSPVDCDTILETHKFEGTCCALNATSGNGCVLNVADGNCIARGQYFTLDYTSTSDEPCPPSEFIVPGVEVPTEAPTAGSSALTVFVPGVWGLLAWALSTL